VVLGPHGLGTILFIYLFSLILIQKWISNTTSLWCIFIKKINPKYCNLHP
jgi:hypothetical protein